MKTLRLLITSAALLVLASCSVVDMAYNNAPTFVANEFDNAFELSKDQSILLDSQLESFFIWHRNQELLRYQQILTVAAENVADGISATEFLRFSETIREAWDRSLTKAIDSFGGLAATLSPKQIEHFQQYHRESLEEFDEYLEKTPAERDLYRAEHSLDRLEEWYGSFDSDLEQRILARLHQLPEFYGPWLKYREARHQALVKLLSNQSDAETTKYKLRSVLLSRSTPFAREFEPMRRTYWQAYALALEDISHWLAPEHHQKAAAKLQQYARVASRLNAQG